MSLSTLPDLPTAEEWLIDGFNVLHVGVLGGEPRTEWWRSAQRERLLERVRCFEPAGARVIVVFDGRHPPAPAEDGTDRVEVVFAPSADEWLVARVRDAQDPAGLAVVTADRRLSSRVERRGARVVAPGTFLAHCGAPPS